MILSTTLKADVQGEFEGGNALAVDWDTLIRRAVENTIDNCRPETLKKRVPIYGGLAQDLNVYYSPSDILVPSDLYDNEGQMMTTFNSSKRKFTFMPPQQFYAKQLNNTYTLEYINGVRFIVVNKNSTQSILNVDTMDTLGTITGGSASLDEHDFLTGSGSIRATVTDTGTEIGDTLATAIDISNYLKGVSIVPIKMPMANNIASVELRLKTDDSNYYSVISTSDSIGDYFNDGWNMVRFNMGNSTQTGTPTSTNITKWSVVITTTTGNTETINIDKITLQKSSVYYLEYYSNKVFIDATTNLWKNTISVSSNDNINLDRDVAGILHYELCLLVVQSASFDKVDGQESSRFTDQLKRKYQAYWAIHPSSEKPATYNISPQIDIDMDGSTGNIQDTTISTN